MRKSLIITVVIVLLCLCGCEAVVTVPESPELTRASEMLLTTTAAEESTDKLEATTTSSVEIDVPGKNEEEPGTPTEDVVSVDNEAGPSENNDPVSSESTVRSFEEVKADLHLCYRKHLRQLPLSACGGQAEVYRPDHDLQEPCSLRRGY